jgi:hypothetical protein
MNVNIAVPNNPVFSKLYSNTEFINNYDKISIFDVNEPEIFTLLYGERVDLALMTPLTYAQGIRKSDFRIIPGPALSVEGFGGLASIFFQKGLQSIDSCVSPTPDDYLIQMGRILLSEKFDIIVNLLKKKSSIDNLLNEFNSVIAWNDMEPKLDALDITEEWFDSFEAPMPLCFWVCKADSFPKDIEDIVKNLAISGLPDEEEIIFTNNSEDMTEDYIPRIGKYIWSWGSDSESILEQTLQLIYFHQLVEDIAAVKILNRD